MGQSLRSTGTNGEESKVEFLITTVLRTFLITVVLHPLLVQQY